MLRVPSMGTLATLGIAAVALVVMGFLAWPMIQRTGIFARSVTFESTAAALTEEGMARQVKLVSILSRDQIRSIDNPRFVSAEDAQDYLPFEPVIGIEIDGDARAYSTYMLSRHEIVNDVVGGVPIAVTW